MILLKTIFKRIFIALALLSFIWIALVFLMPKKSLWYELESLLAKQKVVLHGESLDDKGSFLEVSQAELYLGSMNVARIETVEVSIWGLFNTINVKNLFVGSGLPLLKGLHLKSAEIGHTIFGNVSIQASGNFGKVVGHINQDKRLLELDVAPTTWLKKQPMIMGKLRKKAKGYYFAWHY